MKEKKRENHIFPFLWMRGEAEEVIREEIGKIYECGIREICVEARPHPDFCGPGWWHDMDIIIEEAKKREMRIWILDDKHFPTGYANGLIENKYPERKKTYIQYSSADVFGSPHQLTLNVRQMLKPTIKFWEIGKPFNQEERDKNEFVSMTAIKFHHGNVFTEESIDLSDTFDGEFATFELPEGQWKIVVVYKTRTDGGDEAYINLIDQVSAHTQIEGVYEAHYERYGEEFGKVIAGFFSDEPQFGNIAGFDKDAIVGKKQMPLPWSDELEEMLKQKYGSRLYRILPYLWNSSDEMQIVPQIRFTYMDYVSRLYEKHFSRAIGNWCEEHGVEYIGHVVEDDSTHSRLGMGAAHYFRAMSGQHMAGIDCIGGQVVYGAPDALRTDMVSIDGEFYHYLIGKMGASCGHLDPKKKGRTMCELFGAYGWKFGVRDMKYVLDHLLAKGVNYLVPHAFSMAEYPDADCPPHFYARGNNPEFPYFAELMKYAEEMCSMFSGGQHIATAAVLYDAEAEWSGERMAMQRVGRELLEHQIDFDVVSTDMLYQEADHYQTKVENGKLKIHEESFDVLIVPYAERITKELAEFIKENPGFPVWFVEGLPEGIVNEETETRDIEKGCADKGYADKAVNGETGSGVRESGLMETVRRYPVVMLGELAERMKDEGFFEISLKEAFPYLSVYHYRTDRNLYFLLNESAEKNFCGEICLPCVNQLKIRKGVNGGWKSLPIQSQTEEGKALVKIQLYPGEACVVAEELMGETENTEDAGNTENAGNTEGAGNIKGVENAEDVQVYSDVYCVEDEILEEYKEVLSLSRDWTYSRVRAIEYPEFSDPVHVDTLTPVSQEDPKFSGIIRYEKSFQLFRKSEHAMIRFEHVYEVMTLWVNEVKVGICIRPPYQMEIGHLLKEGENTIRVEVATTPARDQMNYPTPPFVMSHVAMEPTGMFGEVELIEKK